MPSVAAGDCDKCLGVFVRARARARVCVCATVDSGLTKRTLCTKCVKYVHIYIYINKPGFRDDDDELMLNVLRCHLTY